MNNLNETLGLRVLSVSPSNLESNVNVNSSISVTFTSDINPATLTKNIVVFEDYNKVYKDIASLKDYSKYSVVKGTISYKDKVLTYTPAKPFNANSSYIVVLNDKIADIIGNQLIQKYIAVFYTEKTASYPRVEITSPKYGLITNEIPAFKWVNQHSTSYVFQLSKENSFENLILNEPVAGNEFQQEVEYTPVFRAKEGMYFVRIKSESNGEWSDTFQFFIKPITDAVIAEEDTPEMQSYDEFFENLQDPITVLEYFPADNSISNSLKTNIIYVKLKGKVDESRIHLEDCYIYGESLDENHEEYAHKIVNGTWSIVYDSYLDCTYVIFTPDVLMDETTLPETEEKTSEEKTDTEGKTSEEKASDTSDTEKGTTDGTSQSETQGETAASTGESSSEKESS